MKERSDWNAVWIVTGEKTVPWALASAATYRLCHPGSKLRWLASESAHWRWRDLVPNWLAADFDVDVCANVEESDHEGSRRLKVQARRLVQGDFIQTDADILFARPLGFDLLQIPVMAAAPNRETVGLGVEDPSNSWSNGVFFATGWDWVQTYFNTGFIVWRDVPEAHEFSRRWEEVRAEFKARTGRVIDQPSFNKAAAEMGCVTLLDSRYNAPVLSLPKLARGACCYHYYTAVAKRFPNSTALEWLASKFESRATDTRESVQSFIRHPQPFRGWLAPAHYYSQSGQWRNYFERELRFRWDHWKKWLKS